jgi:hypothetical protein
MKYSTRLLITSNQTEIERVYDHEQSLQRTVSVLSANNNVPPSPAVANSPPTDPAPLPPPSPSSATPPSTLPPSKPSTMQTLSFLPHSFSIKKRSGQVLNRMINFKPIPGVLSNRNSIAISGPSEFLHTTSGQLVAYDPSKPSTSLIVSHNNTTNSSSIVATTGSLPVTDELIRPQTDTLERLLHIEACSNKVRHQLDPSHTYTYTHHTHTHTRSLTHYTHVGIT